MSEPAATLTISLPIPHPKQLIAIRSTAKRKVWRAGRRGGKTVGAGILAVEGFLDGRRVLYAAPTTDQLDRFWTTVCNALRPAIDAGIYKKNETEHTIELLGTEQRIKAKTAWNADTLRGDYADLLILDEWQLMAEETWDRVGAPMLLDNDGDAVFIYTPPSLQSRSVTKARDPQHASKLFKKAEADTSGRWKTFVFSSKENPHISRAALAEISRDMTSLSYRQEILAEDIDEAPGALWTRKIIEDGRIVAAPDCERVVVAIDPSTTAGGDEAGIIVAGAIGDHGYVLEDCTLQGAPLQWAKAAVNAYHRWQADCIVAESNQGGQMVSLTIAQADPNVPVKLIHASRGKQVRAAPVSAKYERGLVHHVGAFPMLEDELALWTPGDPSPNRLDSCVYALTEIMTHTQTGFKNHDLRFWEVKGVMAFNRYIVVSGANARKKSPYTAIWVIGLSQDQQYYVIDGARDIYDLGQRVSALFQFHKAYRPVAVGYGEDGWQVDQSYIEAEQRRINYGFNIIPLGDGTPKMRPDDRIRRLVPMFSSHRIFLPGTLNKQTAKGETRNLVADFVNEEYTIFPEGQYDDMLRALSRILAPELNAMFPSPWYEQQESVDPEPEANF